MFEAIVRGERPSDVFRRLIERETGLENRELATRFAEYFENVSGEAVQAIWHWERPGGRAGLS